VTRRAGWRWTGRTRARLLGIAIGALWLCAVPSAAHAAPPANDSPGSPTVIDGAPATVSGSTREATMDADEPAPLATTIDQISRGLDRSVWFSYTAERSRNVLAETCDANFANHLDVYTGAPGALVAVPTRSDDFSECPGERRTFAATAGVTYLIRVTAERAGGRVPDGGNFHLQLLPQEPPDNDAFTRAAPLPSPGSYVARLAFSTIEFGDPSSPSDTGSVWYRLVPPRSEPYTAQIQPNPFGASLAAFEARGTSINGLRRLASDFTTTREGASVSFNGLKGRRYYVRVSTNRAVAGDVTLNLTTNTARGIGLIVTPARNTLRSVRRSGLRATLSCARTCTLGVDLLVGAREARRLRLVDRSTRLRRALRIGHVGGRLQTGEASTVSVPISSARTRRRLAGARSARFILRVSVRSATRSRPVSRTIVVRR
jgi:hypothetical protein